MTSEGYIKYQPNWHKVAFDVDENILAEMNRVRAMLKENNWLGVLPDGIGFGNLSVRNGNDAQFFISGSGTGHLNWLAPADVALVTDVDIAKNQLSCQGLIKASSESMTHAVFYRFSRAVNAVIHIHDCDLWKKYFNVLPTSSPDAEYGTSKMAYSIENLLKKQSFNSGLLVMGGHEDGLIAYGESLEEAFGILRFHKA
ncbi:MAG: class II aldolase/adducin family protein [Prolixibacteraceae bacterium]|nr:class II aldolase/adducin family protein [Prolixibacteraceae bacterium]MBN2648957.1 class II aldolase/adducin family protein [Prolixibacteraceae bacterium]